MRYTILILFGIMVLYHIPSHGQSIRKNFREMGPMEITDYNDAMHQFWNGATVSSTGGIVTPAYLGDYPIVHYENGTVSATAMSSGSPVSTAVGSIHMSPYFLPFHRTFLLDWEQHLKSYACTSCTPSRPYNYLAVPYWNWPDDAGPSSSPITSSTDPSLWAYAFIPASYYNGTSTVFPYSTYPPWNFSYHGGLTCGGCLLSVSFSRPTSFPPPNNLNAIAGSSIVSGVLSTTYFYDYTSSATPMTAMGFSDAIEMNPHNAVHGFISGTMGAFYSPLDPVFWLHHGMVDKMWNDWEESHTSSYGSSDLIGFPTTKPSWTTMMGTTFTSVTFPQNLPVYTSEACSTKVDCRYLKFNGNNYDVWYAENGTVLLNGNKSTDFHVTAGSAKLYRYTVYDASSSAYDLGIIYIGDIKRSGSSVVADTKGGFVVDNTATCDFRAPEMIDFRPGFTANLGSTVTAKIINTPNGY